MGSYFHQFAVGADLSVRPIPTISIFKLDFPSPASKKGTVGSYFHQFSVGADLSVRPIPTISNFELDFPSPASKKGTVGSYFHQFSVGADLSVHPIPTLSIFERYFPTPDFMRGQGGVRSTSFSSPILPWLWGRGEGGFFFLPHIALDMGEVGGGSQNSFLFPPFKSGWGQVFQKNTYTYE